MVTVLTILTLMLPLLQKAQPVIDQAGAGCGVAAACGCWARVEPAVREACGAVIKDGACRCGIFGGSAAVLEPPKLRELLRYDRDG
jgi:hypothetical protein